MKNPRLVIHGLERQNYTNKMMKDLIAQNYFINEENKIKIVHSREIKKSKTWIHYLEASGKTYKKIVNRNINIGWKTCKCIDDANVLQCFNCYRYEHKTKDCKNNKICRKCAGKHETKMCQSEVRICTNCYYISKKYNEDIDICKES